MPLENFCDSQGSGITGLNSNVRTNDDQVLHVQTEDLGRSRSTIVTHVFSAGGQVLRVVRFDYSKHLDHPKLRSILPRALQLQHSAVVQALRAPAGETPPPVPSDIAPSCLLSDPDHP